MTVREVPGRVKKHVKEHKEAYLASGVTAVVASTGTALIFANGSDVRIVSKITNVICWKPTSTINQFIIAALGDPGNVIQDIASGMIYASQGEVARKLGVSGTTVSNHLHGKRDHVNGMQFKVVGKAGHPIEV
jgi:hypothetical protein